MINQDEDPWESDSTRDYLGDGVYVAFDGYSILLRVNHHLNASSEICLEPEVLGRFNQFVERMYSREETEMKFEPGDKVTYITEYRCEQGIVKCLAEDGDIFVVYNCGGEWERYAEYTAAKTSRIDLKKGWSTCQVK